MIDYIQIFGDRGSGTNYLASLIRKNFKRVAITSDFGGKHWFVKNHFPRSKPNTTTDNECVRPVTDSSDTLFLVIYKNPYAWLCSIHRRPIHGDGHWSLSFSEFIRKPWTSYTTKKLNPLWDENPEDYYFIEEARNILELRTQKIQHFNALAEIAENICFLNYESLTADVDILHQIATTYGIDLKRSQIVNDPYRANSGKKKRVGFVPTKYPEISAEGLAFIRENLNWEVEQSIGYNSGDYNFPAVPGAVSVSGKKGLIMAKSAMTSMNQNNPDSTGIDTPTGENDLELTLHVKGLDPIELVCGEAQPVVQTLFKSLLRNRDEIVYLQLGPDTPTAIYFPGSHLMSIESNPAVSPEFLERLLAD
ncbi:MAG TPA: hypothetical protein EYQ20_16230 [candidate division Zixibacteria bacterium]|nr:hypothetical protein [candidate division Zixibacteria bacterium]